MSLSPPPQFMLKEKEENKIYDDYEEETKKEIKELVIARLETIPENVKVSIG